jgi:AcrR family transcriptional regulator
MDRSKSGALADTDARSRLKRVARQLFAERGFRNVSVREIAAAAGQKNHAAVGYHFGSKESLAKEILIDGAMIIEARRETILQSFETRPAPPTIRELVEAITLPSAELGSDNPNEEQYFNRFLQDLGLNHPTMVIEALEGRWNVGYQRCLRFLRPLMSHLSPAERNRRFVFLGAYLATILAVRETMLADRTRSHPIWRSDSTLHDVIETATAILMAPRSRP